MFDPRPLYCSSLTTAIGGKYETNFVDSGSPYHGTNQSMRPQPSHPQVALPGASSSSAQGSMSTSPLKRMERRIKGWFKYILGKQKQLDNRLFRLQSHIYKGEPAVGDAPPLDLEGDSEELDDCVDEEAFSTTYNREVLVIG